ncbi:L,D-transpeptidase [Jannaschia sp. Os4]|uniref:L,D-transpeptidase n=1 Tax=Jannaschia sp. Os4 TaxID=2807617 RepID=UPI0019393607|nr:L,D-transpeptidase [Jannaschia sp. Os4]MBM2577711.1 L,D-transpeptidase [Jannaschia sp. Os4]
MTKINRRTLTTGLAVALAAPAVARAQTTEGVPPAGYVPQGGETRRNTSSFQTMDWRDHFSTLGVATIVADTTSRALHFWSGDGATYRLYPTSVPMTDELTRRGYSEIVRKAVAPSWTPTASMRERDPSLPQRVEGGDPGNPLGTHAMYLDWPAYLIHGTHDTRKIGRRSSSGCIGLYNEKIAELFALTPVGTQVRLI